jgi:hypothetical protein
MNGTPQNTILNAIFHNFKLHLKATGGFAKFGLGKGGYHSKEVLAKGVLAGLGLSLAGRGRRGICFLLTLVSQRSIKDNADHIHNLNSVFTLALPSFLEKKEMQNLKTPLGTAPPR